MGTEDQETLGAQFYNKNTKIWHGPRAEFRYGSHDSIGSIALKSMLAKPDHIAQICYQSGKKFTNREIAKWSIQVARHLEKLQMKQCDTIGLCAANSDYIAPLFFGAMYAGLCISTLDPSFDKDGIRHVFSMTRPRLMFCDGDNYHRVREAFEECGLTESKIFTVHNHIDGIPNIFEFLGGSNTAAIEDYRVPALERGADQVAFIICTSGTTGFPKGVCLSHLALLHCVQFAYPSNIKLLCFSTLYWLSGVVGLVNGTIDNATRIISEKTFNANDFLQIVPRYKVNLWMGPPSQMALTLASDKLIESDLSSLELCAMGGSFVAYSQIEKFKKFLPNAMFTVGYGMSEICGSIAWGVCEPSNSVGKVGPNIEAKIIDADGTHLGPHEAGEICMRSKFHWAGYFNNPTATNAMYDVDGWVHSGDIGYFNEEGKLFVVDRKTDIRKYNNFHFSPTEIETVIKELPQILDVCVVGIPDSIHGFLPAAAVIKRSECSIEASAICEHVVQRMQDFERLRGGVYFLKSLPRTVSGKTLRRKVAEICQGLKM